MRGAEALFPWEYLSSTGVLMGGPGPPLGQKIWRNNRAKDQARDEQWPADEEQEKQLKIQQTAPAKPQ
jgi:hypothetical protein